MTAQAQVSEPIQDVEEEEPVQVVELAPVDQSIQTVKIKCDTCAKPVEGLVAYYDFEGTLRDQVGQHDGAGYNIGYITEGNNKALMFSRPGNYVKLGNSYDYRSRTINLWFKAVNVTNSLGVIYTSDNAFMSYGMTILSVQRIGAHAELYFNVSNQLAAATIEVGKWHNATIVVDGLTYQYFLDGSLVDQGSFRQHARSGNGEMQAVLGSLRTLRDRFFNGRIDDLRIYNRALTPAEIAVLSKR